MAVLTMVDVLRVQAFVFRSNRLRDIVAGSELVLEATSADFLSTVWPATPPSKVVFAAGGNALLEFEHIQGARDWAGAYSRALIDRFPGLEAEVVHTDVRSGGWGASFVEAQKAIQIRKLARNPDVPLGGLGITLDCVETREVATWRTFMNDVEQPMSASVKARRVHLLERSGRDRWIDVLEPPPQAHGWELAFTRNTDELGRTRHEQSLVGIVHIDGNRVGRQIRDWLAMVMRDRLPDEEVQARHHQLAEEIARVGKRAMQAVLARVHNAIELGGRPGEEDLVVRSRAMDASFTLAGSRQDRRAYWPVRPVVLGGDEMTFVCDGRLALDAACTALEVFRGTRIDAWGRTMGACAGVAMVKAHAPFARAYELAERLCRHAKESLSDPQECALDWHIGYKTPLQTIEEMRDRQYTAGLHKLTMRPYALATSSAIGTRSFRWLDEEVLGGTREEKGFRSSAWLCRRNKIRALRSLVREGPQAVHDALTAWKVTAGVEELPGDLHEVNGFDGPATCLLDAIELLDLHYRLA